MLTVQATGELDKLTGDQFTFILIIGIIAASYVLVAFADALRALAGRHAGKRLYHVPVVPGEEKETRTEQDQ